MVKEPIGVVGLITPWNWPLNQITCKVGPALAAGCTMVLKPSEIAPLDAIIFAEILDEAGVPKGVFNLVNGDGPTVGQALASHPDVDMMSFTGSTRAGILVAKAAADTVKRVHQELGGKSANILFPDVDFSVAVAKGVAGCFGNSGQSCNAPTRMFVPRERHDEAAAYAKTAAEKFVVGAADAAGTMLGPVVSQVQYDKIQGLIESGISEGATLVTGGPGRPNGFNHGYYVQPTVFANVTPEMRIAREEIFGPVLAILPYDNVEQAIEQRQRHRLWPRLLYPDKGHREGARSRHPDAQRQRPHQLSRLGRRHAVRRLQAVRQWPRICRIWPRRFPGDQGHPRLRRGLIQPRKARLWRLWGSFGSPSCYGQNDGSGQRRTGARPRLRQALFAKAGMRRPFSPADKERLAGPPRALGYPKVNANAWAPGSRNSISNSRSATDLLCRTS